MTDVTNVTECTSRVEFKGTQGLSCGEWWFLSTNSLPDDQQTEDSQALCWTSGELESAISILGFPEMELSLAGSSSGGNVIVRICDVFKDGASTLITLGVLNLTHRDGHDVTDVKPLVPGQRYKVKIKCISIGYTVPKGNKIRVAVTPNYFPLVWPPQKAVNLQVTTGCESKAASDGGQVFYSRLILPVTSALHIPPYCMAPQFAPARADYAALPVDILRPASYRRHVEKNPLTRSHVFIVKEDSGKMMLRQTRTIVGSQFEARYTMVGDNPLSARIDINYRKEYEYPDTDEGIRVQICAYSGMTCSAQTFSLIHDLHVQVNDTEFFSKKWDKVIPRNNV